MRKVVINNKYGGFSLSDEAIELYGKYSNLNLVKYKNSYYHSNTYDLAAALLSNPKNSEAIIHNDDNVIFFDYNDIARDDPILILVVEELGDKANGSCAKLRIVYIPSDVKYTIEEYDGNEWVAEQHRTWP